MVMSVMRVMMRIICAERNFHRLFYIYNIRNKLLQAARKNFCAKISFSHDFGTMETNENQEVLKEFGKRIQRCYGCFIAYHLKDMYLGEDVTFFCDYCKDDSMFHFDDFSKMLDISKLKEVADDDHHH